MSLVDGAKTIIEQCLNVQDGEEVLVVNDGNDADLIDALFEVLDDRDVEATYIEYDEPENQGEEPPEHVVEAMKAADVVIAPTLKSLSHTQARFNANDNGARMVSLPTIDEKIWNSALQADYKEVKRITELSKKKAEGVEKVRVVTDKGTDIEFRVDSGLFHLDTGIVHDSGSFSNLPAGEIFTGPLDAEGTIVLEENEFGSEGNVGMEIEVENAEVKELREEPEGSVIREKLSEVKGAKNIAEFGFGTNPEAFFVGNPLQDEKILGTIHIALGDNCFCFPEGHERRTQSDIHWDFVLQNPTVWFDDNKVLDKGEPVFMEE